MTPTIVPVAHFWEVKMWLMLVYMALTVAGAFVAYGVGFLVEHPQFLGFSVENPQTTISLAAFLLLYFLNLWVSWRVAVWLTQPGKQAA